MMSQTTTEKFIRNLAKKHNVTAKATDLDRLADSFTRLVGDNADQDEIGMLLVHLTQRGVLSGPQCLELRHKYLRERRTIGV